MDVQVLRRKSKRFKCISVTFVILITLILVITIPLAVVLPKQKDSRGSKSTVLVPLYIYPVPNAWDPLYEAITAHPKQGFTIILNPDSGPGPSAYPNNDFIPQIRKLNTYSNVKIVGYVRTTWATRNITDVLQDVSTYFSWATKPNATGLAVHGIFFDETPNEYSAEAAEYLKTINEVVKNLSGLLEERTTIHNPGMIPDARLIDSTTDYTVVVFEGPYSSYQTSQAALSSLSLPHFRYSYIMHSIPSMSKGEMKKLVNRVSRHSELFSLTDLNESHYESFGGEWRNFIDLMPE